nr:MAG TPA: hypothetical protein [Caudoviricetes sp.]
MLLLGIYLICIFGINPVLLYCYYYYFHCKDNQNLSITQEK